MLAASASWIAYFLYVPNRWNPPSFPCLPLNAVAVSMFPIASIDGSFPTLDSVLFDTNWVTIRATVKVFRSSRLQGLRPSIQKSLNLMVTSYRGR